MINFRVQDLEALLAVLKEEGINQVGETQSLEYGKFTHIMPARLNHSGGDPEGNKLELWEANDEEYDKMIAVRTK